MSNTILSFKIVNLKKLIDNHSQLVIIVNENGFQSNKRVPPLR